MREITNWTNEQIEEFRDLKQRNDDSMGVVYDILQYPAAYCKLNNVYSNNSNKENDELHQDIIDLMSGKAKFKEEKYVFLLKGFRPIENLRYALTRNDETTRSDFGYYAEGNASKYSWFHFTEYEAKQLIENAGLHYDDFEKIEVPQDDD